MNTLIKKPPQSQWDGNKDLRWDLGHFNQYAMAIEFLRKFESTICVFSPIVEQIYAKYEVLVPDSDERNVVILPDFYAHTERFFGIPEHSVVPTGIKVVPGEMVNKDGIHLIGSSKVNGKQMVVDLSRGLRSLMNKKMDDGPFLPILMRGDLREYRKKYTPYLHLHRLKLSSLNHLSIFEQRSIAKMIQRKLMPLIQGPGFIVS
jgi:hypothetical protein